MTGFLSADHHPDCYPSEGDQTLAFFREALVSHPSDLVPAAFPGKKLAGIVTPHIDFRVSTAAYAAAFRPLLDEPLAETYLILGVGHRSPLEWNLDPRDYVTPLGRALCARELIPALAAGIAPGRIFAPEAHRGEHSIEFPLLWLQAIHQLHPDGGAKPVQFIPVLCGGLQGYIDEWVEWNDLEDFHHLCGNLMELFRAQIPGGKLRIIVSIDGCHLGPRFEHSFPVTSTLLKVTEGWENLLWQCAARGDAQGFLDWFRVEGNDRYFDGVGALALLLAAGGGRFTLQRTFYEQWFTERDASAVTFSSGRILTD